MDTVVELSSQDVAVLRLSILRLGRRIRQNAAGTLTPAQLSALSVIRRWGPLPLTDLARREGVGTSTVTRLVARLEGAGYVTRGEDPCDGRVSLVVVTELGHEVLEQSRARANSYLDGRLDALTPAERRVLAAAVPLLERLVETKP